MQKNKYIVDGWFQECVSDSFWPGQAMKLQVDKVLYSERSEYQDILVFKSSTYGIVLVLDGAIQVTERDEHAYHEMMACVPLACRPLASGPSKRVLVIGGGDGGVIRELLRACPKIEKIDLVEIDPLVVDVAQKFMPSVSKSLNDKRIKIHYMDGREYLSKYNGECYDVIISDSTDPNEIGETLFTDSLFGLARKNLCSKYGVLCVLGECMWLHSDIIKKSLKSVRKYFSSASYGAYSIPTYPCGSMGLIVGCCGNDYSASEPLSLIEGDKYYTKELHRASFVLPKFCENFLVN